MGAKKDIDAWAFELKARTLPNEKVEIVGRPEGNSGKKRPFITIDTGKKLLNERVADSILSGYKMLHTVD